MTIQCVEQLTKEDRTWFTAREIYSELNTHPFSWWNTKENVYYKFSLSDLKKLLRMISLIGGIEVKIERGRVLYKKDQIAHGFIPALKRSGSVYKSNLPIRIYFIVSNFYHGIIPNDKFLIVLNIEKVIHNQNKTQQTNEKPKTTRSYCGRR